MANRLLTINSIIDLPVEDVSDGSHSPTELYFHRLIMFATICNLKSEISWKVKMGNDLFIVGIDTPEGEWTLHFRMKFWDYFFNVKVLNKVPEWDGHSSYDIERLLSLLQ